MRALALLLALAGCMSFEQRCQEAKDTYATFQNPSIWESAAAVAACTR